MTDPSAFTVAPTGEDVCECGHGPKEHFQFWLECTHTGPAGPNLKAPCHCQSFTASLKRQKGLKK